MRPAVVLACLQILSTTISFFLGISFPGWSAAEQLASSILYIFGISPAACFVYICLSFWIEASCPLFQARQPWASWALMVVIFLPSGVYGSFS
jgi:hypothetical protein